MRNELSGKKILVTGGTGFIGGRLVEKLVLERSANVRVLLRNYAQSFRIARYPIEMVYGEVTESDDIAKAVAGCDVVVHCAYGNSGTGEIRREVNLQGTRNVVEACLRAGVKRIVHLSTVQVYGHLADGDLNETAPRRYFGDDYSDSKLDAEQFVFEYIRKHSLPAVVVQPTVVYGPYSRIWTTQVLASLQRERHILVNNGEGLCNAVYIDDLADAICLAAVQKEAVGESFLISGDEPVTWRDFYGSYERMLGISSTVNMSAAEAEAYNLKQRNNRRRRSIFKEPWQILREDSTVQSRLLETAEMALIRGVASSLLSPATWQSLKRRIKPESGNGRSPAIGGKERPIRALELAEVQFYKTKARVRIDKAKRLLNYQPAFNLDLGMKQTEHWARWAKLLQ